MFRVKSFPESRREFLKYRSVRRDIILLSINLMDKNACSHAYVVPNGINSSERIFSVLKLITSEAPESKVKKAHQISFSILSSFWSQWVPFICYLDLSLSFVQQNSVFFKKITNVLQNFQMSLAMTWSFQLIFLIATISSTFNLLFKIRKLTHILIF